VENLVSVYKVRIAGPHAEDPGHINRLKEFCSDSCSDVKALKNLKFKL
jgi:hypothetical protein